MIGLGEHAEFIIAAYLGVFAGLALLIGWVGWAARHTGRRLRGLDDRQEGSRN